MQTRLSYSWTRCLTGRLTVVYFTISRRYWRQMPDVPTALFVRANNDLPPNSASRVTYYASRLRCDINYLGILIEMVKITGYQILLATKKITSFNYLCIWKWKKYQYNKNERSQTKACVPKYNPVNWLCSWRHETDAILYWCASILYWWDKSNVVPV